MESIVSVTGGKVRGTIQDGIGVFLGIPYAAPPVGPARFEAPRPVAEWSGVRDASALGPTCAQAEYPPPVHALFGSDRIPGAEYLNVNVWTPDPGGSGLPVMVWIHGGAFVRGANSKPIYDGAAFARDGIVLVSINYRLGISGFAEIPGAPSNRGLLDQVFALRWVRDNVAAFGGDPDNVTLFGQSAGGLSTGLLAASRTARGLFRRAIIQSGPSIVCAPDDAQLVAGEAAKILGIEPTTTAFGALEADQLPPAQSAVALALMSDPDPRRWGETVIANGLGVLSFFPVVDGELVEGRAVDVLAAHPDRTLPLLTGWTADEFRFFTVPTGVAAGITDANLPPLLSRYGVDPAVAEVYSANRPGRPAAEVFNAIITDKAFRNDTVAAAEINAAAGQPTFVYEFAWPSGIDGIGACHVLELPFVFDTLAVAHKFTGPNPPQRLADEMHAAWVEFAKHGDPGWAPFETGTRSVFTFEGPRSHLVDDPRADELAALRGERG
ncbi:carboxylesterase/lipase family protein [Nocardia arthritidis]|nr:carboxylesterase family protein [Nocardia arthritidis]